MKAPLVIFHLRHASASGGGADAALFQDLSRMNRDRFRFLAAFLRKRTEEPARMIRRLRGIAVDAQDVPGRAVLDIGQLLDVARQINTSGATILHCHDPKAVVYGYLLRLLCPRIALVGTLHGWTVKVRREVVYNWLAMRALRKFDAILAVSGALRREALSAGLRQVRLVPNAIDVEAWRKVQGAQPVATGGSTGCAVGFIGRLSPEKGARDFVRTARLVADRSGSCEFFVAGEGPEQQAMISLVAEFELGDRVHFLGHLDESRLMGLYRKLDVVLLTSRTEGLPLVVLEALAMSVPVVATNVGGVGEIIDHGVHGLLAESGDVGGLSAHVLRLLSDRGLRDTLGAAGRRLVESRYSLRTRTDAIEALYRELADASVTPEAGVR